ncbi:twin-arginine translocase TatA/TatE family subunit [Telmatospirillum siberiense]|uniref:Sec-independent protein translocase protein TatA n=1 Tax=Telmatospirillum siberiense TaxID=382514 RepID=A0A2N3PTF8_9PROT|nr:twin-arginine translocase TatA/TatE family subunit [Telmatospirillum siberiense]PKU23683.1 twin-arginine translocase TatA/TatE family subunit [Telmatospirillum siberiense]
MGSFSIWHWIIVLAIVLLLFGTGRVSNLMGDLAKGVKAFKKGLQEDEGEQKDEAGQPKVLTADSAKPAATVEKDEAVKH